MQSSISDLSAFVLALGRQAEVRGIDDLLAWAVAELADVMGFDAAWYGWAQVEPSGTVIHASSTYNLPDSYYRDWTAIADQDVLVDQFIEDLSCVPTYDRFGARQTDGMEHLADRHGITQMATAMCLRSDRTASLFVSAYRGGTRVRHWTPQEREFLQCAVDNMSHAARLSARHAPSLLDHDAEAASLVLSRHGAALLGLASVRARFGHLWSRGEGDHVPRWLSDYVDQPGEHLLTDQNLVAHCDPVETASGPPLYRISLRPMRKFDLLSQRERDVARALASGQSHKETARLLGVAPSTVRNQTRSIYSKLGVDNRASLALHVPR